MSQIHEPDPRFLENLEWQLTSEWRRRQRFRALKEYSTTRRNLKMISVIVCSVLTGVMATTTAAHIEMMSHRQLLLAQADTRIQLADSRLQYNQQLLADVRRRIELGLASKLEGGRISGDVARLEIEKQRLELDREEIRLSGRPPQNDLSAPLLSGRDFVAARFELDLKSLKVDAAKVQAELDHAQLCVDIGVISPQELGPLKKQRDDIRARTEELNRKIELRARFRRGEVPAKKVDLLALTADAEMRLEEARTQVTLLQEQLTSLEVSYELGRISDREVEKARSELESAKAAQKMVQFELQTLQLNLKK